MTPQDADAIAAAALAKGQQYEWLETAEQKALIASAQVSQTQQTPAWKALIAEIAGRCP